MSGRAAAAQVRIEPWAEGDLDLLRRANAPEMTEHLGGPESDEQVLARHQRYLTGEGPGNGGMFRVVVLPDAEPAGIVGYWPRTWHDAGVFETGWHVLPEFQGRGIAAAAVAAVLDRARAERTRQYVHAFPSVDNAASNAICRKVGFSFVAECDFEYPPGHPMRCNDWRFDLTAS